MSSEIEVATENVPSQESETIEKPEEEMEIVGEKLEKPEIVEEKSEISKIGEENSRKRKGESEISDGGWAKMKHTEENSEVSKPDEESEKSKTEEKSANMEEDSEKPETEENSEVSKPDEGNEKSTTENQGDAGVTKVAEHYNAVPEKGITERTQSRIFYLRNFNNWMKSMLIGDFLGRLKEEGCPRATVLDLCCGKGGDFLKWRIGNVSHLVATDIAAISMEQCKQRYVEMKQRVGARPIFTVQFINADATKVRLADLYTTKDLQFNLCSCQFSFHYSFESEKQARFMIRNAVERIAPGGYFIGTLPDAERIMWCIKNGEDGVYSNEVLRLAYGNPEALKDPNHKPPIFGCKFDFHLDTQVNCPEYLVHFPVLQKLLEDCGMEFVYKKRFAEATHDFLDDFEGRGLMGRMQALEQYPPVTGKDIMGKELEYKDAHIKWQEEVKKHPESSHQAVGTLSQSEWEVASMYYVFAFRKIRS